MYGGQTAGKNMEEQHGKSKAFTENPKSVMSEITAPASDQVNAEAVEAIPDIGRDWKQEKVEDTRQERKGMGRENLQGTPRNMHRVK